VNPDPILRGVFIARRLACLSIAAPPDGVPPLPPVEGKTNRQTVEEHTETPGSACVACHAPVINPFGFAFEHYDSTGAFRTEDNGFAVDSRAVVALGGGTEVADALELAQVLAADESVHACYIRHWLEFAMGRPYVSEDAPLTERLGEASLADEAAIEELLVSLVVARPFRNRAVEEYQ
jgi:hypothetical protein